MLNNPSQPAPDKEELKRRVKVRDAAMKAMNSLIKDCKLENEIYTLLRRAEENLFDTHTWLAKLLSDRYARYVDRDSLEHRMKSVMAVREYVSGLCTICDPANYVKEYSRLNSLDDFFKLLYMKECAILDTKSSS